jgi:hypothetical protein
VRKIRAMLEANGIEFIEENGTGEVSVFGSRDTQDETSH